MKTLFVADLHLEAGRDLGIGDYGPGSRFDDQVRVLDRVADLAIAEECGVVAVVGDVFHKPHPLPQSILAFQEFVYRLLDAGCRIIVLAGNHDIKGASLPTALDLWRDHADVNLATQPRIIPIGNTVYACLPWTPISNLIANIGRTSDLRETAIDLLVQTIQQLRIQCDTEHPDATPILLAHWSVSGSSLPNGLPVDQLGEPVIPWFDIDVLGFKLTALGHIHRPQLFPDGFDAASRIFYCGSTCVGNLGEMGSEHGVWIFDHAADLFTFHPIEDRPFLDYTFSVDEAMSLVDSPDTAMPETPFRDAVVRIRWRQGEGDTQTMDEAAVRNAAIELGAHKVFIKEIDKPTASRSRVDAPMEDVSAADALALYVDASDVRARRNGDADRFVAALSERHLVYVERVKA